ncbi:exosortase [Roseomonas sp. SSH11]|uniref:Exosortase n=1 Tax=Pararoseomonas baculiformis TaxID=2820812 RepID=A0ABS4ADP5_9PROT|nr:exosortase A [Pararoseomonas baculiformis]MBP0445132.1 exosortase [Pararoseomonas baculiformis]
MAALALGMGVLAFLLLFREEVEAAVHTWMTSAAYNHGPLILPIAIWLAWARRDRLASLLPSPSLPWALAVLPLTLGWLAAERMGIMEGRQLTALAMLYALLLTVLGWRVCRAMAVPIAYLVFLVPFGAFTVPWLQAVTAKLIALGLSFTSIPHYIDGLVIEIPAGTFYVAEACAGLRFIIATLAFGALYAAVMFRSPGRRLLVMALAVVVPILANGARGFGLVVIGHLQGSAAAVEADHVLYGWVFFSFVLFLLILAGLPFREDTAERAAPGEPPAGPSPAPMRLAAAAAASAALLATGPAVASVLDRGSAQPVLQAPRLAAPAGCTGDGTDTLHCPGAVLTARLLVFPAGANWSHVAAERRRAVSGGSDEDVTFDVALPGARWRARQPQESGPMMAAATWLGGKPAGDGLGTRAKQALRPVLGGTGRPVVAIIELRSERRDLSAERLLLRDVLQAQEEALAAQAVLASSTGSLEAARR